MILHEDPHSTRNAAARDARSTAIAAFAAEFLDGPNRDLYEEMLVTICRLARDRVGRGDLKLMHKSLAELRYAYKVLAPFRDRRKISMFGSARTPETHADYTLALAFAERMVQTGWMVITGAGDGIMKAGHAGAGREHSIGVAIRLPFEQRTNTVIADDPKLVNFRYFFTRKIMFVREASAVALFPGGFGTQDECFEALTLIQTGKAPIVPIIMMERPGGDYWKRWDELIRRDLLANQLVGEEDLHLYRITTDIDAAVEEVTRFYRVYHSMRFVGDDLVLRLVRPITDATLGRINDEFQSIVDARGIERIAAMPGEAGEFGELPRLKLRFNRRSCGLLRRCIDVINQDPG